MPTSIPENHRRRPPPLPQCLSRGHRKLLLFFLKCVIMVVVISIFLFFLGFAAIVLIHFLLMSTAFRRRCHVISTAAAAEASPRSQALPGVTYSVDAFLNAPDCAICLDSFREGDLCWRIPVCKHLFHADCVDRWIRKNPTCPVCRSRVDLGSPGSRIDDGDQWKRLWAVGLDEGTSY
ncbi:hypothetical protein CASFOL_032675 [Castilleja foliolosa]|uniref:RING-type domain-containing protein n=1 Tax=Castilleja foliolosa TaxID=1961234 RepID=A0ABD3C3G1_9LAMI